MTNQIGLRWELVSTDKQVIVESIAHGKPRHVTTEKAQDKWWRISDEKVKESKVTDVLNMQKEVYLLFYEMVV